MDSIPPFNVLVFFLTISSVLEYDVISSQKVFLNEKMKHENGLKKQNVGISMNR